MQVLCPLHRAVTPELTEANLEELDDHEKLHAHVIVGAGVSFCVCLLVSHLFASINKRL